MHHKIDLGWIKHYDFMILDMVSIEIAFVLAFILRHGLDIEAFNVNYREMTLIILLIDIVLILLTELFHNVLKRGYYIEIARTTTHVMQMEGVLLLYLFVSKVSVNYSRKILLYFPILYLIISYVTRIMWKQILARFVVFNSQKSLLLVVTQNHMKAIAGNIRDNSYLNYSVKGMVVLDQDMEGEVFEDIPIVANSDNILDYLTNEWVDEIFFSADETTLDSFGDNSNNNKYERIIDMITDMGIVVHINLGRLENIIGQKQSIEKIGRMTVLTTSMNSMTVFELLQKRTLDIIGGLIGCLITLILTIIVGPIIYISSPGPIFFTQDRVGKNGKIFKMYKFRSMYMDAEERKAELMEQNQMQDDFMFKLEFDPRIIGCKRLPDGTVKKGIGNYIRDLSIDEFPQFFNVLKGDMSLVGTRPPLISEVSIYEYYHKSRLAMKPGITGLWQVSGRSQITNFDEVVRLDRRYVNEWSFGMDLRILLKTVLVVLKRDGAM